MATMPEPTTYAVEDWFTADDLASMGDDGQRYELLDGEVFVTPPPVVPHQRAVTELLFLLRQAMPPDLRVLPAPTGLRLGLRRQLEPDLLVVGREEDDAALIERQTPLLVVEVLSPGTRGRDQVQKRQAYEHAGIASYWQVDPAVPSLTVLELHDRAYAEVAHVEGEQAWTAQRPYAVTVVPADLLR